MRERAACLGRKGLEEQSDAGSQEGFQGVISPSCSLSSGTGALLPLHSDLVVLFMHKLELRMNNLVQMNRQLDMAQVPSSRFARSYSEGEGRVVWPVI